MSNINFIIAQQGKGWFSEESKKQQQENLSNISGHSELRNRLQDLDSTSTNTVDNDAINDSIAAWDSINSVVVEKVENKTIKEIQVSKTNNISTYMIYIIPIIVVVIFFIVKKIMQYNKELKLDKEELMNQNIYDKFKVLMDGFNSYCFNDTGKVNVLDDKNANVYKEGSNQIVMFLYNAGMLTVVWKYKYFEKEMVYERSFPDARNATEIGLKSALEIMTEEFKERLDEHKAKILNDLL
ncbi:hypothetical protein ACTS9M_12610 [Empedobacter sp. ULE_I136]